MTQIPNSRVSRGTRIDMSQLLHSKIMEPISHNRSYLSNIHRLEIDKIQGYWKNSHFRVLDPALTFMHSIAYSEELYEAVNLGAAILKKLLL